MLRSWDLKLDLNRHSDVSLHLQIAQRIIDGIQLGRLPPETAMPGSRELAQRLKVNRKTVILTYDELIAQGWLVTQNRRGTFVSKTLPHFATIHTGNNLISIEKSRSSKPVVAPSKTIPDSQVSLESFIDFSEGSPDMRLIPYEILARAFRRALVSKSRNKQIDMDHPKGNIELRTFIASMLNLEKGMNTHANNICVVNGTQLAMFITARILSKQNDCIVFEDLTYPNSRDVFKSCGAKILHVSVDEHGIKINELEKLCQTNSISAVFVTPQHQFPTTVTMSEDRRKGLLRLATQYNFMIIEDNHDQEFDFSNINVFPLASSDKSERVIYIGSISKVLSQGLRIGYLVASESFINECGEENQLIDRQQDNASELAILELMHSGEIKRHVRRMSKIYKERRDVLQDLIHAELHPWLYFSEPNGGLAFWLQFKVKVDMVKLIKNCAALNVHFSEGSLYSENNIDVQAIRLSFAKLNLSELSDGVQRIKRALIMP